MTAVPHAARRHAAQGHRLRRLGLACTTLLVGCAAGAQTPPASASAPTPPTAAMAPGWSLYAAGSLRAVMTQLAQAFARTPPSSPSAPARSAPRMVFGASGLLRERLAGGEAAQLFASANMSHPQALVDAGRAAPVVAFARNALCGLAAPGFSLQGHPWGHRLLDDKVRVATSTPKADPAGDYAFEMFDRIESSGMASPGSADRLKRKALQLTGGPSSPPPPADRNVYGAPMAAGQADVFITYCTNAAIARREVPSLQVLEIPESINVSARYGMTLLQPVNEEARAFQTFVLSPAGQQILAEHGFKQP